MAERANRDIMQFISMYPTFKGGCKCQLEAAVAHHNKAHTTSFGSSLYFAAYGEVPILPADKELGIDVILQLF